MPTEQEIQDDIREFLRLRGWETFRLHGNVYQKGIPDLYACHPRHGPRWIEVKKPKGYKFTKDQLREFPRLERAGDKIWILCAGSMSEYQKLFGPPNWRSYLKAKDIERIKRWQST